MSDQFIDAYFRQSRQIEELDRRMRELETQLQSLRSLVMNLDPTMPRAYRLRVWAKREEWPGFCSNRIGQA